MTRLAAEFWVKAYIKRLSIMNIPAYVVHRGDDTAGAIWVKVNHLNGHADLFEQSYDLLLDARVWQQITAGSEIDIDAWIARGRSRDSDLWLIEIESPDGLQLLEKM